MATYLFARRGIVLALVWFVALCSTQDANAAPEPDPQSLLRGLMDYTMRIASFSCRLEETNKIVESKSFPANHLFRERTVRIWKDKVHLRERGETRIHTSDRKKSSVRSSTRERLVTPTRMISLPYDLKSDAVTKGIYAASGDLPDEHRQSELRLLLPFMFGLMLNERQSIPDILKDASLSVRRDRILGRDAWVLTGTGKQGEHSIWLDAGGAFTPLKIVAKKRSEHDSYEGVLGSINEERGGALESTVATAEATAVDIVSGLPVVSAYSLSWTSMNVKKVRTMDVSMIALTDIRLGPLGEKAFQLQTHVPNGTKVTVEGQEMIAHEWRDGEIVKSISQATVDSLEGQTFKTGRGWVFWLVLAITLLVVAGGLWWLIRPKPSEAT